jgi:soluble lytic murein transglycosylase-like protein
MTTDEIKQLVISKANQYGVNPGIALAQIQRESGFNPNAVGAAGERGLAQFMQGTWQQYGAGSFDNAFDPAMNLDAWGNYMAALLGMFSGDYAKALTGYNGGPGHLTDPGRYGPPSAAAVAYGQQITAQAGFGPGSVVNLDSVEVSPIGGLPLWLLLAGGALLLILVVKD